jgi:hypothetical protein
MTSMGTVSFGAGGQNGKDVTGSIADAALVDLYQFQVKVQVLPGQRVIGIDGD